MSGVMVTELVLMDISTGQHHASAAQPVIFLTETPPAQGHCSVMLEIVGDNLALLLTYRQHLGMRAGPDTFQVYNWRTGALEAVRQSFILLFFGTHNYINNDIDNLSHYPHRIVHIKASFFSPKPFCFSQI